MPLKISYHEVGRGQAGSRSRCTGGWRGEWRRGCWCWSGRRRVCIASQQCRKPSQPVNILFHKTAVGVKLLQVEKMPACPVYGMFFVMCVFLFSEVLDLVGRAVVNQTLLSPWELYSLEEFLSEPNGHDLAEFHSVEDGDECRPWMSSRAYLSIGRPISPTRQFLLIFEMSTKAVAIPPLLWWNGLIILGSNMHLVESESSKWSCALTVGPLASCSTEGSLLNDPSPLRDQWYPLALGMNVRQNLW